MNDEPYRVPAPVSNSLLLTTAALALMIIPATATAADWPNWMGPNLNGISTESVPTDWPDDGLPTVWSADIGIGFSSVSIVDGRLYTMGHRNGEETIWCLDANDGSTIWTHSYPAELNDNLYEGGPGATPTVDQQQVFCLSIDGRLTCLDRRTGKLIWEVMLQDELDVGLHEWGFDSSPLVLDGKVIVQGGRVAAFDRHTGKKIWQSPKHAAGYGAVRPFRNDGRQLLASLDCDGLRITDPADGTTVALAEWKSPFGTNSTTPIIHGDLIFISTGYNVGCGLFRLNGSELKLVYTSKRMRNHFNNSILLDGHLYGMDGNSNLGRVVTLTCMEFETGDVLWKQRGLGCGSLMVANDHLLILSEDGDLVLAEATPTEYTEVARSSFLDGRCWTVPVLLNGRVYGRNAAGDLKSVSLPRPGN